MDPHDWYRQRAQAQNILGVYGKSVVESLPDMMFYFLSQIPQGPKRDRYIFDLAVQIDLLVSSRADPVTDSICIFPMGKDVVIAGVAESICKSDRIQAEEDLCVKASMVLEEVSRSRVFRKRLGALTPAEQEAVCDAIHMDPGKTEFHPNFFRQIVFPMVFGAKFPITARDVLSVNEHFPEQEDKCIKFINTYSVTFGSNAPSGLSLNPMVSMDLSIFFERMVTASTTCPGLVMRALLQLGFMGPSFFGQGPFLPKGVPYMFPGRCLPLAFAEYFQDLVEQTGAKKGK